MLRRSFLLLTCLLALSSAAAAQQKGPGDFEQQQPGADLPQFEFYTLSGKALTQRTLASKPSVIMLFDPHCEHCQQQAQWLADASSRFQGWQFLFVSTGEPEAIRNYYRNHLKDAGLDVQVARDEKYQFDIYFGYSPIPSIYVYDTNLKLAAFHHSEEVKPASILRAVNR